MNCNCLFGHLNDYDYISLRRNTIANELKYHSESNNRMVDEGFSKRKIEPKDYLDKRHNMAEMFNYCPYCGGEDRLEKGKKGSKLVICDHESVCNNKICYHITEHPIFNYADSAVCGCEQLFKCEYVNNDQCKCVEQRNERRG